jgi:DNA-binding NtrC family response regulator
MSRILVVDDLTQLAEQYAYDLKRLGGHEVTVATSGIAALARLEHQPFDCVILDLEMPGMDGFEVLEALAHHGVSVPVIVYTGTGNFDRCIRAVQLGAAGFIDKAEPMERVALEVANAIERARLGREVGDLRRRLGESRLIGAGAAVSRVRDLVVKLAAVPTTVLIQGESGTGKEVVARELHRMSPRANRPLIAINCAALPETLVESELFGHEKGAFTGAIAARHGAFEAADGGTLFLDEIGELPLPAQAKLLRALEQRTITRVGATEGRPVDIRLITATNRDLAAMVDDGQFREDLLFRINPVVLVVPPLRDHPEDIPALAEFFIAEIAARFGVLPKRIAGALRTRLIDREWRRNNVRELRNVLERMMVMAEGEVLTLEHLPPELDGPADGNESDSGSFHELKTAAERRIILAALEAHDWNVTKTAAALDLSDHASLLKIMRRLGIRRP